MITGIRGLCNGLGPALYGFVFFLFNVELDAVDPIQGDFHVDPLPLHGPTEVAQQLSARERAVSFSLTRPSVCSELSSPGRRSSSGRARWSWPSSWPFSSRRKPPAPPLPPSWPSARSPTQTAKSPCPRASTRPSPAARTTIRLPLTTRTLSRFCRTAWCERGALGL